MKIKNFATSGLGETVQRNYSISFYLGYSRNNEIPAISGLSDSAVVSVVVPETLKNHIVEQFLSMRNIISFELGNLTRHLNTRNIVYMDVMELVEDADEPETKN